MLRWEGKDRLWGWLLLIRKTSPRWEPKPCLGMTRLLLLLSLLILSYLVSSQQLLSTTWHLLIGLCLTKPLVTVVAQCLYSLFLQSPYVLTWFWILIVLLALILSCLACFMYNSVLFIKKIASFLDLCPWPFGFWCILFVRFCLCFFNLIYVTTRHFQGV